MKDEELRKILRTVSLDDPGDSFTDEVMSIVESQEALHLRGAATPVLTRKFVLMLSAAVLLVLVLALMLPGSPSHHSPGSSYFRGVGVVASGFLSNAGTILVYGVPIIFLLLVDYFFRARGRVVG